MEGRGEGGLGLLPGEGRSSHFDPGTGQGFWNLQYLLRFWLILEPLCHPLQVCCSHSGHSKDLVGVHAAELLPQRPAASCLLSAEFPLLTGSFWDSTHLCAPLCEWWHLTGLPKAGKEERGGKTQN